ncbi:AAA family ATPase [Dyadobacter sp. CY356]|uniref:AAA family ATPase n=1 Tax=Dyadobacter sp. CY356 TaxID=2906442 RepID=UPI001F3E5403|nr:AAA family ATPase [Dyadobacter sp. CY356]MCF0057765.1 AAA family ATPase [Dyadobacter sp. CY356]
MDSFINHIEIKNFKSIRHLEIDGFKRINLFIGKPNVGKSNILEALSIFTIPYLKNNLSKKLTDLIRLEESTQIFYEGNFNKETFVELNFSSDKKFRSTLTFKKEADQLLFSFRELTFNGNPPEMSDFFFSNLNLKSSGKNNSNPGKVKRYAFNIDSRLGKKTRLSFLNPPYGNNLMYVLELLPELREVFTHWFKQYGLRLVLDKATNSLKIMKDNGLDVFIIPYSLIADTLQRIIFFKTAVVSNTDSILVFEEPEAHSFPPYIAEFTQEVIHSDSNQFFIATHSPIIVDDFLENAIEDLAIFMIDFKEGQTVSRSLSETEIQEVFKYGIDLFFNSESYSHS